MTRHIQPAVIAIILLTAMGATAQTNSTWENVKEGTTNAWQKTKEGSSNVWEKTKEGSVEAWHDVKQGTTQAWSNAKEKFQSSSTKTNYVFAKKDEFVAKAKA